MRNAFSLTFTTLLGSAAFVVPPVSAQELNQASQRASSKGSRTDQTEGAASSDAIVVTARRKEEALTSVPASITAYSSDYLKKQNIASFADYATKIPNLSFQYGQGSSSLLWSGSRQTTIRGVVGSETTAYYINDTPVPSSVSPQVLNLDRIEVLKGPQGTLFGASSMGGNLRYITKKPSLNDDSGIAQLQSGYTHKGGLDIDANGQANLVLAPDKVALDIAAGYTRDSGYITRRFPDGQGNLVSRDGQGRNEIYSGSATVRAKLSDSLEMTASAIGQVTNLHGFPAAYAHLPEYVPISLTVDRAHDVQEYAKDRWGIGSIALNYTGDGFSVVSSTSYFKRNIKELEDDSEGSSAFLAAIGFDVGNPIFVTASQQKEHRFTQEVRLSFDDRIGLPGLSGILGVYYQHANRDYRVPRQFSQALADADLFPAYLGEQTLDVTSDDTAIFGELYYEIAPKLTLTLGLRHYWIKQKRAPSVDTGFIIGPDGAAQPGLSNSQSGFVPKAVVSYKIGDQGNIYASVAKGFRPGGSQLRLPDFCGSDLEALGLTFDGVRQFKSDKLWSYEVGAKSKFANGRVSASAAAFQIDWSSIQQFVQLPTCGVAFTGNAGKARIRGGEFELSGRPFAEVPLTLQVGIGYTSAILTDPGYLLSPAGSRLPQVPHWTASISGYYEHQLTADTTLFASADYSYTAIAKVSDGIDGFYDRQPFNIVNGNIGISFGPSQVLIYTKNLFDKRLNFGDQTAAGFDRFDDGGLRIPRVVVSRPRQIGVQFRQAF